MVSVVVILSISFKMSVKFGNDVGKVELVDKVKWWDVFFIMFGGVIDSWRRQGWRGDLFDEWHGGLRCLSGDF